MFKLLCFYCKTVNIGNPWRVICVYKLGGGTAVVLFRVVLTARKAICDGVSPRKPAFVRV